MSKDERSVAGVGGETSPAPPKYPILVLCSSLSQLLSALVSLLVALFFLLFPASFFPPRLSSQHTCPSFLSCPLSFSSFPPTRVSALLLYLNQRAAASRFLLFSFLVFLTMFSFPLCVISTSLHLPPSVFIPSPAAFF